ncbi:MAG: restriction endonuclease subunit S [Actinomycetota bacterium]|nr:restriction endonuclease subunit S [Actinomycetota bacterium]
MASSISSGTTTRRLPRGAYPLYGSTGQIGYTDRPEFTGPSILVARVGANAGSVYRVDGTYGVSDNTLVVRLKPRRDVAFFEEVLRSRNLNNLVYGSGQPLVTGTMLKRLSVPSLSPPEETAIAEVLADANALVASLERLLDKKRDIKQGMAQLLLTGETRLPGFGSSWTQIRLGDVGSTYSGLAGKSKADFGSGSSRFVTFVDVINNVCVHGDALEPVVVGSSERQNQVVRGDVLFNGSSETPEEVALGAVIDFDPNPGTYLNSFCFGYRIARRHLVDPVYLAYMTRSHIGRRLVFSLAQGATRYNISKRQFLDLAPAFPPIEEQQAITAVLKDVDTEIAALKQRLAKAMAIKHGMAQQLLTGRVRLPDPEPVA